MANPGPNIVAESLTRGEAVLAIPNTPATVSAVIKASTVTEVSFTVSGVAVGDFVSAAPTAALPASVSMGYAYVSAANTVKIGFTKVTASDTADSAGTYLLRITRPFPVASNVTNFGSPAPMNAGAIPLSS
ncbi:MAG: hypothetical protein ACR2IJ_04155 [Fluviibacter sp.]